MGMSQPAPADIYLESDPDKLATFVQEYVRREGQDDAGSHAVIASQLRDPRWLPHQIAEMLLSEPTMQAAIKVLRTTSKPKQIQEVSVDTISADMEVLYQEAKDARQYTAAIAAKKLQAEISGFLIKHVNVNVKHSVATMADGDLEAIARRGAIDAEFTDVTPATGLPAVLDATT